jgi:hypothetical protein
MTEVARLRDSTQIVLPTGTLDGLREELQDRFVVTVHRESDDVRIIGSPVVIKNVSNFLAHNGIPVA